MIMMGKSIRQMGVKKRKMTPMAYHGRQEVKTMFQVTQQIIYIAFRDEAKAICFSNML